MDQQTKRTTSGWRAEAMGVVGLLLGLALLGWQLWGYFVPAYYGLTDENGYLVTAKRLAVRGDPGKTIRDPYEFAGETMMQGEGGKLYVRQPIGYPLLCAAAYTIGGSEGPFWVSPVLALGGVLATYLLVRSLLGPVAGGLAALLIGAHPLVAYYGLRALSHAADLLLCTVGLWLAWRWYKHGGWWVAGLGGLVLGLAVTVRYLDVLLLPAVGFLIAARRSGWSEEQTNARRPGPWKDVVAWGAGMAVGVLPVLFYQQLAFGAFWRTGYAAGGNATSFSLGWFTAHMPMMLACLLRPGLGLGILLPLGVAGVVGMWWRARVLGVFLALWIGLLVGGYTAYYGAPQSNTLLYARFFLGVYPAVVLAALWVGFGAGWSARVGRVAWIGVALAVVLTANMNFSDHTMAEELNQLYAVNKRAAATAELATRHLPAGAVVLADQWMPYLLDYMGEFWLYDADHFKAAWVTKIEREVTHVPSEFDPRRGREVVRLLGGKSDQELTEVLRGLLTAHLQAGRTVALVTLRQEREEWAKKLGPELRLVEVAENQFKMGLYRVERAEGKP